MESAINELYQKAEEYQKTDKYMNKIGCQGCKSLEYLESTGKQWIDTSYKPNDSTKIKLKGNYTTQSSKSIFGANPYFVITSSMYGNVLAFRYNNNLVRSSKSAYEKSIIVMSSEVYVNDELDTIFSKSIFNSSYSALLFARRSSSGDVEEQSWSKLYYFMIYDNNILVRDYIPVLDINDRPCLFDKVEKKCYYNQGTGEFLYG